MKYVIIGNSTAAVGAIDGIRSVDKDGEIVIISNEKYHTYSRPLISYLLCGKTTEELMKYRPDDFYTKNKCKTMLGKTAVAINKDEKVVVLSDGREVSYDKLLLATGSSPFVPAMEGLDHVKKKFSFMSLDDAKALDAAINKTSRVLIVGAGLIGLKCAEGIAAKVAEITVIDLAPRVLSSILDDEPAKMIQNKLEENGMHFILGHSAKSFAKNAATLDDGRVIPFDVLVLAVGVRANTSLLRDAGGEVARGIITDDHMLTSLPDIYAAGDCAESYDVSSSTHRVLALLPNAYRQGECAGINMAGGDKVFDRAIPMNAIGFFGLHVVTAGSYDGDVHKKVGKNAYKALYCKDDRLVGFILIGDVDKAGIYTSLVRNMTPLSEINFDLIFEKPSLLAFSKKYRCEKLGSVV